MKSLEEQILKAVRHTPWNDDDESPSHSITKAIAKIALERIKEEVEKAWENGRDVGIGRFTGSENKAFLKAYLKENGLL